MLTHSECLSYNRKGMTRNLLVAFLVFSFFLTISSNAHAGLNRFPILLPPDNEIKYHISPDNMQSVIYAFKENPLHAQAHFLEGAIFDFADNNKNVLVVIHSRLIAGLSMKNNMHRKLFIAFVAGNLLPQLQKKIKKDHSFEGITFMIGVYQKLRTHGEISAISSMEKLQSMSTAGLLKYVSELEKNSIKVAP